MNILVVQSVLLVALKAFRGKQSGDWWETGQLLFKVGQSKMIDLHQLWDFWSENHARTASPPDLTLHPLPNQVRLRLPRWPKKTVAAFAAATRLAAALKIAAMCPGAHCVRWLGGRAQGGGFDGSPAITKVVEIGGGFWGDFGGGNHGI